VGSVVLRTPEAGADIFVNGRKLSILTSQDETRLPGFPPGKYNIVLAKQGFEPVAAQSVEGARGKIAELKSEFKRLPPPPAKRPISGAPGGTEVFLDQTRIGATQDDGSFSHTGITPGVHTIVLRRRGYVPKALSLNFDSGQTIRVSGNEAAMTAES